MKKVLVLGVIAAGVGLAGYKYSQSRREQSLWAEATTDTWEPVEEQSGSETAAESAGGSEA